MRQYIPLSTAKVVQAGKGLTRSEKEAALELFVEQGWLMHHTEDNEEDLVIGVRFCCARVIGSSLYNP